MMLMMVFHVYVNLVSKRWTIFLLTSVFHHNLQHFNCSTSIHWSCLLNVLPTKVGHVHTPNEVLGLPDTWQSHHPMTSNSMLECHSCSKPIVYPSFVGKLDLGTPNENLTFIHSPEKTPPTGKRCFSEVLVFNLSFLPLVTVVFSDPQGHPTSLNLLQFGWLNNHLGCIKLHK